MALKRVLVDYNGKQSELADGDYIKPNLLGSGTPSADSILNGNGQWVSIDSLNYWKKTGFVLSYESTNNAAGKATFNGGFEIYSTAPYHSLKQRVTLQEWKTQIGANTGAAGGSYYSIFNVSGGNHGLTVTTDGNVAIGTLPTSESSTNSRLYVYGGDTGANIDVRGLDVAFKDQATLELQGSEYSTAYSSTRLQHRGANYGTSVSILGLVTQNFGELTFQEVSGAVIRSTNTTPILVGINNLEVARFLVGGFKVTGSIEYSTTLKPNGNAGTSGYFLKTTGTANSWSAITLADISDYSAANVNYWTLAGGNVYRSTGKVFIGHSGDMGAYSFQVTGDSIFSNKIDVRGIVGIGTGYSSTNAFTIESLLTGGANHTTNFKGHESGTNDTVIWSLSRGGGAYGEFAIDFVGIRRFYIGGAGATPHSYIMPHTNFGVGTTLPNHKLDVNGDLRVVNGGKFTGQAGSWYAGGQVLIDYASSQGRIQAYDGSNSTTKDLLLQWNGGNVGINRTDPSYKLDVYGIVRALGAFKLLPQVSGEYSTDATLSYYAAGNGVYLNGNNTGFLRLNADGNQYANITLYGVNHGSASVIDFTANNSIRARIYSDGKFVINGTSTNGSKIFQVNGGIRQTDVISGLVYANSIGEFQAATASNINTLLGNTSLTTNYVTKWNGTALANSNIEQTAAGLGINISPARTFHLNLATGGTGTVGAIVGGTLALNSINAYGGFASNEVMYANGHVTIGNNFGIKTINNGGSWVDGISFSNGNVILGNTGSVGAYKLQVTGSIYGSTLTGSTVLLKTVAGVITRAESTDLTGLVGDYYIKNQNSSAQAASGWIDGVFNIGQGGYGTSKLTIQSTTNSTLYALVRNNDAGSSSKAGYFVNAFGNSWGIVMGSAANNSNNLEFTSDALGTSIVRMVLTTGGNVGVGTGFTPSAKFHAYQSASLGQFMFGFGGVSATYLDQDAIVFRSGGAVTKATFNNGGTYLNGFVYLYEYNAAQTGYLFLNNGGSTYSGYIGFHKSTQARLGYIGFDNTNLTYVSENGAHHAFLGNKVLVGTTSSNSYKVLIESGTSTNDGLYVNGHIRATGNIIADGFFSGTSSDRRYKSDFKAITVIDKIDQIDVNSYQHSLYKRRMIGSIAQDVEKLFPELVYQDDNKMYRLYDNGYAAIALQLGKEIKSEVDILKERVKELEQKLERLNGAAA